MTVNEQVHLVPIYPGSHAKAYQPLLSRHFPWLKKNIINAIRVILDYSQYPHPFIASKSSFAHSTGVFPWYDSCSIMNSVVPPIFLARSIICFTGKIP